MQLTFKQSNRKRAFAVESVEHAVRVYAEERDRSGLGGSQFGEGLVSDDAGEPVRRISYNGRTWHPMSRQERARVLLALQPGQRVRFLEGFGRYGHFSVGEGSTGVVDAIDAADRTVGIRVDGVESSAAWDGIVVLGADAFAHSYNLPAVEVA